MKGKKKRYPQREEKSCTVKEILNIEKMKLEHEEFRRELSEFRKELDYIQTLTPLIEKIIEASVKIIRNRPIG